MTGNDDSLLDAIGQILGDDHGLLREARERHAIEHLDFPLPCEMLQHGVECGAASGWMTTCIRCGGSKPFCLEHYAQLVAYDPIWSHEPCGIRGKFTTIVRFSYLAGGWPT